MTFAVLRALHAIIGEALDDVERVYASHSYATSVSSEPMLVDGASYAPSLLFTKDAPNRTPKENTSLQTSTSSAYASPPPSPGMATHSRTVSEPLEKPLDFPSLDAPCDPTSPSETLTSHPTVVVAINRILAAAGQMATTVQTPFMTICDATMGYHLPSCLRILEASNTVEILREAGPAGLHVKFISELNGVDESKLAHILRLLATHHIMREVSPDVFALNRISSLVDSGKSINELKEMEATGRPELKYQDTNGIAAFVGLCTDEIYKSSAYLTETYLLSPSQQTREGQEPTQAPFCYAFDTAKSSTGYFGWLEGETSAGDRASGDNGEQLVLEGRASMDFAVKGAAVNPNRFRLERFGKAMSGTGSWEAPGAVLNGFDWKSLPRGSVVVDVGGGIGSTSMLLATASEDVGLGLKFVIQDRSVVVEMGKKAWRAKRPELLDSGSTVFEEHDFFSPQPVKNAAVFLLRVILHDWPDDFARRILLQLREAATPQTKLLIADWVLPLACLDDMGSTGGLEGVEGAESMLAPAPLLPNLGKASANAYWMDMTMQVMFNAQERTLREIVALALSAGWKVVNVTKAVGSLFGHITAVPVPIPAQRRTFIVSQPSSPEPGAARTEESRTGEGVEAAPEGQMEERPMSRGDVAMRKRSGSRCDTFGTRTELSSFEEALAKFGGGGVIRPKSGLASRGTISSTKSSVPRPAVTTGSPVKKKRPSPLSVPPPPLSSLIPASPKPLATPRQGQSQISSTVKRQISQPQLYRSASQQLKSQLSGPRQPPPSPSWAAPPQLPLSPRSSHSQLSHANQAQTLAPPSLIPIRQLVESPPQSPREVSPRPRSISRPASFTRLPQSIQRKPSIGSPVAFGIGVEPGMGAVLLDGENEKSGFGSEGDVDGRTSSASSGSYGALAEGDALHVTGESSSC